MIARYNILNNCGTQLDPGMNNVYHSLVWCMAV